MYDTLLILIFVKNFLEEQEAVYQFLLTVLLIVVMNCFLDFRFAFRKIMYHLCLPLCRPDN